MAHKKLAVLLITAAIQKANVLVLSVLVVNLFLQVTSSFVNVVLSSTLAQTLASVKTILFSLLLKVK